MKNIENYGRVGRVARFKECKPLTESEIKARKNSIYASLSCNNITKEAEKRLKKQKKD